MTSPQTISVTVSAHTDVGIVRANNEDNFLIQDLSITTPYQADALRPPKEEVRVMEIGMEGALLAVSDGMGGALAGEVASQMAVRGVARLMQKYQSHSELGSLPLHLRLRLAIETINSAIHEQSQRRPEFSGMGATFTATALNPDSLYLAQVGDSRAYLIRGNRIKQLTKDQSLVEHLLESGYLTEAQAERHAFRNVILQALGAHPETEAILDRLALHRDDLLILCSDGLSNKVHANELLGVIQESTSLSGAGRAMIELAKERGGEDNITVIIAQVVGENLPVPGDEDFQPERIERTTPPESSSDMSLISDEEIAALAEIDDPDIDVTLKPRANHPGSYGREAETFAHAFGSLITGPEVGQPVTARMGSEDRRVSAILLAILGAIVIAAILAGWWYLHVKRDPGSPSEPPAAEVARMKIPLAKACRWQTKHPGDRGWTL